MKASKNPLSRRDNIVVQQVNGEVLIYDLRENKAFCLNETSAIVWQACDGKKTVAEIASQIGNEDLVWLALSQLKKENLLENEVSAKSKFAGMSRREVVKKVGLGSMIALPVVTSLVAPLAVHANSACVRGGSCVCAGNGTIGEICPNVATACTDTNCRCQRINNGNNTGTCVP